MNLPRLVPASNDPAPISLAGPCPGCGRSDALRTARTETGRHVRCRFAFDGLCDWEGVDRPFRRPAGSSMPSPFVERLGRIAERVVDEAIADPDGRSIGRIDVQYVPALRSAVRRVARDRDLQVRTTHVGEGRIEVRLA